MSPVVATVNPMCGMSSGSLSYSGMFKVVLKSILIVKCLAVYSLASLQSIPVNPICDMVCEVGVEV